MLRVASVLLTSLVGRYLHERYWPGVYRRADESPSPAFAPSRNCARPTC